MAYLGPAPANSIIATSDIEDGAVTSAKLGGNIVTPGTLDVNGQELILDANANTSITADTDDQIDIKVAGADDFQITANTMSVLSGSTLNIDSGATIANSGTATGFTQFANWSQSSGHLTPDNATYGIHLGVATATASNLLDDYEEGTWTPVFVGATTAGSPTSPAASGWYTKIGNHVHLDFQLYTTDKDTAAGSLRIDGIPFTMNSHSAYRCGGSLGNMHNINFAAGDLQINLYGGSSYTYIYPVFHQDSAGSTVLDVGDFINGGWFMGSISYTV